MSTVIAAVLVLVGCLFSLAAGVGMLRLPDVFIRMHAATKVGTLGSGLVMAGTAVHFGEASVVVQCVLVVFFLLLTAPIAAHMIGRAAVTMGIEPWTNEEAEAQDKAHKGAREAANPLSD